MRLINTHRLAILLSTLAIVLPVCLLLAWILFDASQWAFFFSSPYRVIAVVFCNTVILCFWIWMLVSYMKHRREDGTLWGLFLLLGMHLAAVVYYFAVYQKRRLRLTT